MMRSAFKNVALIASSVIAGCTSGFVGTLPHQAAPAAIPGNDALQFVVGTAVTAPSGCSGETTGINTVVTYRQSDGSSAVLYDTPTITGPPGFVGDQNTNTIFSSFGGLTVPGTAVGSSGSYNQLGAFGYGFAGESAASPVPVYEYSLLPAFDYTVCPQALFSAGSQRFVGGPPAWPAVNNGLFPVSSSSATSGSGFVGYPMGFYDYVSASAPPAGTYTLTINIPIGAQTTSGGALTGAPASFVTRQATATLKSLATLPVFPRPTAIRDPQHPGGLIVTAVVPPGLTEAFAEIQTGQVTASGAVQAEYYTLALPVTTPGQPVTVILPPQLGLPQPGTTSPTPSIPANTTGSQNAYAVYAVGFDYDAFGPSYPLNRQQRPALAGANGQADVTTSASFTGA